MGLIVRFRSAVSLLGRFPALAGVDLDVVAGEVLLVHGANGAGKTTLLRACAGLVPIAAGEATVLGHDLRHLWLLVEPHAGLDAAGRELVDGLIGEAASSGATVVLVSHELDRAAALADRQVAIAGGRIEGGTLDAAPPASAGHKPGRPAGAGAGAPPQKKRADVVA